MTSFDDFSRENRRRCEAPNGFNHRLGVWSTSDWITALVGEVGEAANLVKKLNRIRDGIGNRKGETEDQLHAMLREELADAFTYLDLLAQSLGFDILEEAKRKFDRLSTEIGYDPYRPFGAMPPPPITPSAHPTHKGGASSWGDPMPAVVDPFSTPPPQVDDPGFSGQGGTSGGAGASASWSDSTPAGDSASPSSGSDGGSSSSSDGGSSSSSDGGSSSSSDGGSSSSSDGGSSGGGD